MDKRYSPIGERKYMIKTIHARHHEIARRIALGQENVEIANALRITPQNVSDVRNSPLMLSLIKLLQDSSDQKVADTTKRINSMLPKILDRFEGIIEDQMAKDTDVITLGKDLLDRGGYSPTRKILHGHLTAEDLREIKQRAKAVGIVVEETNEALVEEIEEACIAEVEAKPQEEEENEAEDIVIPDVLALSSAAA